MGHAPRVCSFGRGKTSSRTPLIISVFGEFGGLLCISSFPMGTVRTTMIRQNHQKPCKARLEHQKQSLWHYSIFVFFHFADPSYVYLRYLKIWPSQSLQSPSNPYISWRSNVAFRSTEWQLCGQSQLGVGVDSRRTLLCLLWQRISATESDVITYLVT